MLFTWVGWLLPLQLAARKLQLTPPNTWSCPTLGLACVLMSRQISPEHVLFPDFWVSNIPRYFSFAIIVASSIWMTVSMWYFVYLLIIYSCMHIILCHKLCSHFFLFFNAMLYWHLKSNVNSLLLNTKEQNSLKSICFKSAIYQNVFREDPFLEFIFIHTFSIKNWNVHKNCKVNIFKSNKNKSKGYVTRRRTSELTINYILS